CRANTHIHQLKGGRLKMVVKCKFCKEEITRLTCMRTLRQYADLYGDDGVADYHNFYADYDDAEWEFTCPECGNRLAGDEESAVALLTSPRAAEGTSGEG